VLEILMSQRNIYLEDIVHFCTRDDFHYKSFSLPHPPYQGARPGDDADSMYMFVFPAWIFCLASMLFGVPLLTVVAAAIRRRLRLRWMGCCGTCGYDLTGNTTGVCSECGSPLPPEMQPPAPTT